MQLFDLVHQSEIGVGYRSWSIIDTATANPQNFSLLGEREFMSTVNHRFTLSNPALVSVPSKKSFSRVSSPILACSIFISIGASSDDIFLSWLKYRLPRQEADRAIV